MQFELFIVRRYLLAKRKQAFISVISIISALGVAVGVASLIVAMGIMSGFTKDLRDRVIGLDSQVMVTSMFGSIPQPEDLYSQILDIPEVTAVTPFIYTELMISTVNGAKGLILRGIDPETAKKVITLLDYIEAGSVENLVLEADPDGPPPLPGVIIGKVLAERLHLKVGDRVNLLSPMGKRTTTGTMPVVKPFQVAAIFSTGMLQYDTTVGFVSLEGARNMTGLPSSWVSGIDITTNNLFSADKTAAKIKEKLGQGYNASSWMEHNSNVFAALQLEKLAMGIVLGLIIVVASFLIISTLIMLVMEKTKDIAILMSMGASAKSIRRIFMLQGMFIGLIGEIVGFILGLGLCFALKRYKFIELPRGAYPTDYVPVYIVWQDLVIIAIATIILCFLSTLYPARQASKLLPAEALHYE